MSKRPTKAKSAKPDPMPALSFVAKRDRKGRKLVPFDFWSVNATGDYLADCNKGVLLAEEFLRELNKTKGMMPDLGCIVRDMIAKGRFNGLEVGFFHRLSLACLDHPFWRLAATQCLPPYTEALFEEHYAAQTRAYRERMNKGA